MLFVIGCNDSAIPEVEFQVPDEDQQLELTPPSANPEPPELVERYLELWEEIELRRGKTGTTDSAAVQEANAIADELAQYDGYMSKVYEAIQIAIDIVIESDSTGQSIEEIEDKFRSKIVTSHLTGTHCPSCESREDCERDCEAKKESTDSQTTWTTVGSAALCIGVGAVGEIASVVTANLPGFLFSLGTKYACLGTTAYTAYQGYKGANDTYDQCMQKCRYQFPKLDE